MAKAGFELLGTKQLTKSQSNPCNQHPDLVALTVLCRYLTSGVGAT